MQIKSDDFGTLAICALRYCMGRQTYMPGAVRDVVKPHLRDMDDRDIKVMWEDCERQKEWNDFGDPVIDKPGWLEWAKTIKKEKERRGL